jgi:amino acid adenylation domain-containing protein
VGGIFPDHFDRTLSMISKEFKRDVVVNNYWEIVRQTIDRYGDKEFIVTKNGSITYAEANRQANVIFAVIQTEVKNQSGLGVGLFMKDHLTIVPAMMGVLKSRNYFVPLDVDFPESTLRYMLENAGIKVVLTVDRYANQIRALSGKNITVLNLDELNFKQELPDPIVNYSPEDVIQILYTSGSTGRPKGAIEDYRYLVRAILIKLSTPDYEPNDRILHLATFTYSGPHFVYFTALINGYTVCYYDVKEYGFAGLSAWIHQQNITGFHAVPTVFRSLISVLDPEETFPSVTTFYSGAEKSFHQDIQNLKKYFPGVERIQLSFTATETQIVSMTMFPADYDFGEGDLPSGFPPEGLKVSIWDEHGNPLPPDKEGEVVVYGDAMARGYINNPELTRKRFIPDPDHPGWQYFKTGDLGKLRPDGQLVHLGRMDNMVKIRGVRIELESIENHLLSYPGIVQVASRAFEDPKGNKRLASYFVAEEGIQIPISDLRKHLAERLPLHLLPHYLIQLDKFPPTTGGKVAISQLPLPKIVRPPLSNDYVPPTDELERQLVTIWEERIGIDGIGVTDDFFEVGGDSLIGALLFANIEEVLGKDLPVSVLLTASTIRKQADLIRHNDIEQSFSPIIPIHPYGGHAPLFFIPGQGGYPTRIRHLAKKLDPQTPIYALQFLATDQQKQASLSIESIAFLYLNAIKKLYPHGPYVLVGESSGGKIAYEMGQQLLKVGEKVPVLALLDTYNTEDSVSDIYRDKNIWSFYKMLVKKHLTILLKSDWQGRLDYLRFYRETGGQKFRLLLDKRLDGLKKRKMPALPDHVRRMETANRQANKEYQAQSYPGRVILFKALRGSDSNHLTNGWDQVSLGELVIHSLDCYHGSILFEPAVSRVAEIIQGYIEEMSR